MNRYHVPSWVLKALAFSGSLSLFGLSFLDSVLLPLPSLNDLLLTVGSVTGSVLLYFIARKGEEAAFHKKAGSQAPQIRNWIERNGFITLIIAALLPPPTPFKLFVVAAGAFGMPFRAFLAAMSVARALRFLGEGYLATRYGSQATRFLVEHSVAFAVSTAAFVLVFYWIGRGLMRRTPRQKI